MKCCEIAFERLNEVNKKILQAIYLLIIGNEKASEKVTEYDRIIYMQST